MRNQDLILSMRNTSGDSVAEKIKLAFVPSDGLHVRGKHTALYTDSVLMYPGSARFCFVWVPSAAQQVLGTGVGDQRVREGVDNCCYSYRRKPNGVGVHRYLSDLLDSTGLHQYYRCVYRHTCIYIHTHVYLYYI